jgi:molybdate transport system substrate-binding protein
VFAAASPKQPAALYAKKLVDKPVEFATNRLVLIVPKNNPAHISAINDITKPGVKLVICQAAVPCGDYARKAFENLGITDAAMKNVASQTTDVTQTVAQVSTGQADAGFVYITDAKAASGKVRVIELPAKARPRTEDYIAVVKSGKDQSAAQTFVQKVLSPRGQATLRTAGFGTP